MDAIQLILVSDMHINSAVALMPPAVNRDHGGTYHASRGQRALWEAWLDFWKVKVHSLPGYRIGVFNGDLGELDLKRRTYDLVTTNKAEIIDMAVETLAPALEVLDDLIVIRGTAAHTGKSQWLEEVVANDIDITLKDGKTASWYHFRGVIGGVKFDIAHHASMGRLPRTEKNAANQLVSDTLYRYMVNMKQPPPDVILRSHNHKYADSGGNFDAFCVFSPCWSLLTEFAYRTGRENDLPDIGGLVFSCQGGKYEYQKFLYKPKASRLWTISI